MKQLSRCRRVCDAKVDITNLVIRVIVGKLIDQLKDFTAVLSSLEGNARSCMKSVPDQLHQSHEEEA
jgi:hypothetical protein